MASDPNARLTFLERRLAEFARLLKDLASQIKQLREMVARAGGGDGVGTSGGGIAKTGGSGIPAMSGSTPGSATVTPYTFNGTTVSSTTPTFTCYNTAGAVAANKFIQYKYVGGYPFVDVEAC